MRGLFISFEGIDGSGKSTQCTRLMHWLAEHGHEPILIREPGGTPLGEQVRAILLDRATGAISGQAEALLYAASRAELVTTVITPALEAGRVVVADRFVDSSLAYQGAGRGLGVGEVERANDLATGGLRPDITILVDVDPDVANRRRAAAGEEPDRLELAGDSFFTRVARAYDDLARRDVDRIVRIDGNRSEAGVWATIEPIIASRLGHGGAAHPYTEGATTP